MRQQRRNLAAVISLKYDCDSDSLINIYRINISYWRN